MPLRHFCIEILNEINLRNRVLQSLNSHSCSQNNPHFCLETAGPYLVHKNPPLDPIRNKRNALPFLTTHLLTGLHFVRSLAPTQPEAVLRCVFQHIPHLFTIFLGRLPLRYLADASYHGDQEPRQLRECHFFFGGGELSANVFISQTPI